MADTDRTLSGEAVDLRWPWLDGVFALVSVVVLEAGVLAASHRRGPVAVDLIVAAVIGLAALLRRRTPLAFLIVVGVLGSLMNAYLVDLKSSPVIGAYFVLVPSYAVGAWAQGTEGVFGLAFLLGGTAISELITQRGRAGDFAGAAFAVTAPWAAGRAVRSYRLALGDMRRILGVLRHGEDRGELHPQPGVDQIYALIERARNDRQHVELSVQGDPGTLSPGVELALYRILESALYDIHRRNTAPIDVRLRFGSGDLDLQLTTRRDGPNGWPTSAMRERLRLCGGQVEPQPTGGRGWEFSARLPCAPQEQLG